MRVLTPNLKLIGNSVVILSAFSEFPGTPEIGTLALVNGVLYVYSTIDTVSTWYPLTNQKENYVHTQSTPSLVWTINHMLGTKNLIYFTYDSNDKYQTVDIEFINDNTVELNFTESIAGRCVLFCVADKFGANSGAGGGGGYKYNDQFDVLDADVKQYTLSNVPSDTVIPSVSLEGVTLVKGETRDYTISGQTITLNPDVYIEVGMVLNVIYG